MGLSSIELKELSAQFIKAIEFVFNESLEISEINVKQSFNGISDPVYGSMIQLAGKEHKLCVFLLSDALGCQNIADRFISIQMGEDEDDEDDILDSFEIPDIDYADALGEVLNMAAGRFCLGLEQVDSSLQIGLPVFLDGHLVGVHPESVMVTDATAGEHEVRIGVMIPKS